MDTKYTRTELVWPDKRTQVERVALPFQVVETVNQSRATREQTPMLAHLTPGPSPLLAHLTPGPSPLAERGYRGEVWKNKLIWGENKYVLASLLAGDPSIGLEPLAGKIDLIYIDPPFATGQDFSYRMRVGDEEWTKEASIIEETAYRDTWGRGLDSYLQVMYDRLVLMRELLAEDASIYVHLDWHVGDYVKTILDEIFGQENFINEIVWAYFAFKRLTAKKFPQKHDVVLSYSKTATYVWHTQYKAHKEAMETRRARAVLP